MESQTVEYKSDIPKKANDLKAEISAFLNTNDGIIYLGVDDDGMFIPDSVDKFKHWESLLSDWIQSAFNLPLNRLIKLNVSERCFAIHIKQGEQPPYYYKDGESFNHKIAKNCSYGIFEFYNLIMSDFKEIKNYDPSNTIIKTELDNNAIENDNSVNTAKHWDVSNKIEAVNTALKNNELSPIKAKEIITLLLDMLVNDKVGFIVSDLDLDDNPIFILKSSLPLRYCEPPRIIFPGINLLLYFSTNSLILFKNNGCVCSINL